MPQADESSLQETSSQSGEEAVQGGNDKSRFKAAASRVVQNSRTAAQRLGRQSVSAAGQLAGNARGRIEEDPLRSAGVTFVIGLGVGLLIGRCLGGSRGID